jgi:hypothetical protein
VILTICVIATVVVPTHAQNQKKVTVQDYMEYLTKLGKTDPEALQVKEQFEKLSNKKKRKFMYYMNRPEIILEALNTPLEENTKKEFYNGDIVVERKTHTETIENESNPSILDKVASTFVKSASAAPAKQYRHTDVQYAGFFGSVKIAALTNWVQYTVSNGKVVSIQDGDGYCSSYSPVHSWTKSNVSRYIYGNKAHTAIVWHLSPCLIVKPSGISVAFNHHILGFANGGKTYRWYRG